MGQNTENFKRGCAEMIILYLLTKDDMYGYQMTATMDKISEGRFTMLEGSLYLILYRLVEAEYITTYTTLVGKKRTRRYYHLEEKGKEYLKKILSEYDEISLGIALLLDRNKETNIVPLKNALPANE
ncbi:MAG: PadR family transcriptional regulator [Clostridia bacterium]|nr:PadR family transcriptional regulator [Clostridia bacterium]